MRLVTIALAIVLTVAPLVSADILTVQPGQMVAYQDDSPFVSTGVSFPLNTTVTSGTQGQGFWSSSYNFHKDGQDAVFDLTFVQQPWSANFNYFGESVANDNSLGAGISFIANQNLNYSVTGTVNVNGNTDHGFGINLSAGLETSPYAGSLFNNYNYHVTWDGTVPPSVTFAVGDPLSSYANPYLSTSESGTPQGKVQAGNTVDLSYQVDTLSYLQGGSATYSLEYRFSPAATPLPSPLTSGGFLIAALAMAKFLAKRFAVRV